MLMVENRPVAPWRGHRPPPRLQVDFIPGDAPHCVDLAAIGRKLAADGGKAIRPISPSCTMRRRRASRATSPAVRRALDESQHPAPLLVDAVVSLGAIDYRHDEWRVDATIAARRRGMMLPPGMGFNADFARALAASATARLVRAYAGLAADAQGQSRRLLLPRRRPSPFSRLARSGSHAEKKGWPASSRAHHRFGGGGRHRAVKAWGLELLCARPEECSSALTAVMMPEGHDADAFRKWSSSGSTCRSAQGSAS